MLKFSWAYNSIKLHQAEMALTERKKLNPALVIDEAAIKEEYIKRAGLLTEDKPEVELDPRTKAVIVKRKDPKDKKIADLEAKLAEKEAKKAKKEE